MYFFAARLVAQIVDYYGAAKQALTLLKQEDNLIMDYELKHSHVSVQEYVYTRLQIISELQRV